MGSQQLFKHALQYMPGGVNSPVRSFGAVGGTPIFLKSAQGARVVDVDQRSYIDYVGSWGAMVLGHAHPAVVAAVQQRAKYGLSFGACHPAEIDLARKICAYIPSIERVRFVNSGTEAVMSALRLARGYTGRQKIIKCAGCYHGHVDSLLVNMGSGGLTFGRPSSAGVSTHVAADTLVAGYNDLSSVRQCFEQHGDSIAAIIVEPVAGNMGCVLPAPGFLSGLRSLCDEFNSLLIFDEVMTGFRVALGGAQTLYQIRPDLTVLGKIIGGGVPVGAFGGSAEIMQQLAPQGSVYQAGTLSGNPLAMVAGGAMLDCVAQPGFYSTLAAKTERLAHGLQAVVDAVKVPVCINAVCGMMSLFFNEKSSVDSYDSVVRSDVKLFKKFFHRLLEQGIYWPPSSFESVFVSAAHSAYDIDVTIDAVRKALQV